MSRPRRSSVSRVGVLVLSVLATASTACSDEQVWYRAAAVDGGWIIARAGIDDDSCVIMRVAEQAGEDWAPKLEGIDVRLRNEDGAHVEWVREYALPARYCSTSSDGATNEEIELPDEEGSGRVRFKKVSQNEWGQSSACRVELAAEYAGIDFAGSHHVWDRDCEKNSGETRKLRTLEARIESSSYLIVSAADPENSTCTWLTFHVAPYDEDEFEAPLDWALQDGVIRYVEDLSQCTPANMWDMLGPSDGVSEPKGRLSFPSSETFDYLDGFRLTPCTVSLNLTVETNELYYWAPWRLKLVADDVVVDGACAQ